MEKTAPAGGSSRALYLLSATTPITTASEARADSQPRWIRLPMGSVPDQKRRARVWSITAPGDERDAERREVARRDVVTPVESDGSGGLRGCGATPVHRGEAQRQAVAECGTLDARHGAHAGEDAVEESAGRGGVVFGLGDVDAGGKAVVHGVAGRDVLGALE